MIIDRVNFEEAGISPFIETMIQTDNSKPPALSLTGTLFWDGHLSSTSTTTGLFHPGAVVVLDLQGNVAATGEHTWSETIAVNYGTSTTTLTRSGYAFSVNEQNSPFGNGWTFSDTDQLVNIAANPTIGAPAGLLRIYGTGGFNFYPLVSGGPTPTYLAADDNGTITFYGSLAEYIYTTPAGDSTTFNAQGDETQWQSADGDQVLSYSYGAPHVLTLMTASDGGLTQFSGTGPQIEQIKAPGPRVYTLSNTGSLTSILDPDSNRYSSGLTPLLTGEQFGELTNVWAYNNSGVETMTTSGGGIETLTPAVLQGAVDPVAGVQGQILASDTMWSDGRRLVQTLKCTQMSILNRLACETQGVSVI